MAQEIPGIPPPKSHKSLKEKLSVLKSVLDSAAEHAIIAKDLDGIILTWNEGHYV